MNLHGTAPLRLWPLRSSRRRRLLLLPAAQARYPKTVVMLTTHSSPGGGSDVFLREMAPHLARVMGVKIVVDNLAGGSGAKAMAVLSKAKPDGGMFYATTPTFVYTSLLSKPAASFRDLEPIVNIFYDPEVLYTATNSSFKTLEQVIAHARTGKGRWGAANPASLERQVMERLKQRAKVMPVVATFEGGGDMLINVLNHTLDMGIGELQEIRAQLDAGRVRILAVAGDARLSQYPDVKTVKEHGIDLSVRKFRGIAGPQGNARRPSLPRGKRPSRSCWPTRRISASTRRTICCRVSSRTRSTSSSWVSSAGRRKRSSRNPASSVESRSRRSGARRSRSRVGYYLLAAQIPESQLADAVGPQGLPRIYAYVLGGLSLVLIARSLRASSPEPISPPRSGRLQPARPGPPQGGHYVQEENAPEPEPSAREPRAWRRAPNAQRASQVLRAFGVVVIGAVYIVVVPWLGYIVSLAALIAATTYYQGGGANRRVAIVSVSGALLFWLLFVAILGIQHPAGFLAIALLTPMLERCTRHGSCPPPSPASRGASWAAPCRASRRRSRWRCCCRSRTGWTPPWQS